MQQERISIIVTSAGTASAISVIKSLKSQKELNLYIIAVDLDPLAAGLFLADEYQIVPAASNDDYIPTLLAIAKRTHAKILLPIYSKEIKLISEKQAYLKEHGLLTFLSSPETIELCNDKRAMYAFANKASIAVPKVYSKEELSNIDGIKLPIFAKPNSGSSSAGAEKIISAQRINELLAANKDFVFQDFVEAEEVTVDVFCNEQNEAMVIAPRLRMSTKSGQSVKGKTIDNSIFTEPVKSICKLLKIKGVCNVQFFIKNNELIFIEVNPRFAAGGLMLTINSGAHIPLILVKTLLGMEIQPLEYISKNNYVMTRYWEEIIFEEK